MLLEALLERGSVVGFELFDRRAAALSDGPRVTVQKRGIVGLNASAHDLIGRASMVEFLYDRSRQVLALRPAEGSPHGYSLREPSETGYTSVSAVALANAYGLDVSESRRYTPFVEQDMLCIDLSGPSVSAARGRLSSAGTESAEQ